MVYIYTDLNGYDYELILNYMWYSQSIESINKFEGVLMNIKIKIRKQIQIIFQEQKQQILIQNNITNTIYFNFTNLIFTLYQILIINYNNQKIFQTYMTLNDVKTKQQLQHLLSLHRNTLFLHFYSPWYGPCKYIKNHIHKISQQLNVAVAKINVEQAQDLANQFQIQGVPTFIVIHSEWNNQKVRKTGGNQDTVTKLMLRAQRLQRSDQIQIYC